MSVVLAQNVKQPGNAKVEQWVRPEVQALTAYHVPNSGRMIKLDAMENPYTWPAYLRGEWTEMLASVGVNRYPDPDALALKERIREAFAVPYDMGVMLGNGSDELIQLMAMALAGEGRKVLAPEPGFSMYRMIATFVGMDYVGVPLRSDDFGLDMPAMLKAIEEHQPALVFLAYPNNPTGNLFSEDEIIEIVQAAPGLVVVDEAYHSFARQSMMSRLEEFDNLVVMRTLSKMGLAGLRLGFLAGPPAWLNEFDKLRLPYNINVLTQVSAELALTYIDVFDEQTEQLRADRQVLIDGMKALDGIEVFPTEANFVLFRVAEGGAGAVFDALKAGGVLIKNLDGSSPLLKDCLRVTVGRPLENQAFLAVLAKAVAQTA